MPPAPNAKPKKIPAIIPTRPGISSGAKTTIAGNAELITIPIVTATHTRDELQFALNCFARVGGELGILR